MIRPAFRRSVKAIGDRIDALPAASTTRYATDGAMEAHWAELRTAALLRRASTSDEEYDLADAIVNRIQNTPWNRWNSHETSGRR